MAARANLNIAADITDEFVRAQETRAVRIFKIKIEGEQLLLDGVVNRLDSASEDFDNLLVDSLREDQACFALFCMTDVAPAPNAGLPPPPGSEVSSAPPVQLQWLMVSWIPDGCRVRDKMLYSSSRDDLKRSIGIGYFKAEYAANYLSDISWEQFQKSLVREVDLEALTETERLVIEEKAGMRAESSAGKSTALGVIPFELSALLLEKLTVLTQLVDLNDESVCNWVEMTMKEEKLELLQARYVSVGDSMQDLISSDHASFIALKLPKLAGSTPAAGTGDSSSQQQQQQPVSLFIYSCPEGVPIREKMTMSSSKASVLAAAQSIGLTLDKMIEIRDADDIDDLIRAEIDADSAAAGGATAAGNSSNSASAAANLSHSRPQRPGKGKARVAKFVADST